MEKVILESEADNPALWQAIHEHGLPCEVSVGDIRTPEQNRKLWPMLGDVSKHCKLYIDGAMTSASAEDWKTVFLAALIGETRIARGINGGLVFLSGRSSKLGKRMFSQLIEIIYAYGSEHDVPWSEPALAVYAEYREAQPSAAA